MRTPLTSIRGALGLLSAGLLGNVDAKAQNLLRIASTNTERLIRLINDILDLERMESGRAPLKLRRCSMYDLAREAVDTMTTDGRRRGHPPGAGRATRRATRSTSTPIPTASCRC